MHENTSNFEKVKENIEKASYYSSFWRNQFKNINFKNIKNSSEYQRAVPELTRLDIVNLFSSENYDLYALSSNIDNIIVAGITGGTSKSPFIVPYSRNFWERMIQKGIEYYKRITKPGDRVGLLYGQGLAPAGQFHQDLLRRMNIAGFPIGGYSFEYIIKLIRSLKVNAIAGSAKFIRSLFEIMREEGVNVELNWVLSSGTKMLQEWKEEIEKEWKTHIYQWAGATELLLFAFGCQTNPSFLHLNNADFFIELAKPWGADNKRSKNLKSIIVTTLYNTGFHLFRYRLGDVIEIKNKKCDCNFDNNDIKFEFVGREIPYWTLHNGAKIYDWEIKQVFQEFAFIINYDIGYKFENRTNILIFYLSIKDKTKIDKELLSHRFGLMSPYINNLYTSSQLVFQFYPKIINGATK